MIKKYDFAIFVQYVISLSFFKLAILHANPMGVSGGMSTPITDLATVAVS